MAEQPTGGGGGYNIPVSLSAAQTFSIPQTQNSPFYVTYGSGNRVGGDTEVSPTNYNPSTATSSAALGGDSSAVTGEQGGLQLGKSGLSTSAMITIGVAVVSVAITIGFALYLKGK